MQDGKNNAPPESPEPSESPDIAIGGTGKNEIPVPGRVQSRINIAKGSTRYSPSNSAGFNHVVDQHFDRALGNNRSVFSIEPAQLETILQRSDVVGSPVTGIDNGLQFVRTVNVGETIGNVSLNYGGGTTSWIKIFTDKAGNLITAYPVPGS
jgi:hypothetical protein